MATIREVINQLLQYPMDAPLHVLQGNALNHARAAQFIFPGEEGDVRGFVICSEAEFAASQQAQAEAAKEAQEDSEQEGAKAE